MCKGVSARFPQHGSPPGCNPAQQACQGQCWALPCWARWKPRGFLAKDYRSNLDGWTFFKTGHLCGWESPELVRSRALQGLLEEKRIPPPPVPHGLDKIPLSSTNFVCFFPLHDAGEDSWESLGLQGKETKPVNPKGNPPWMFIGRTDAKAEAAILWPLMQRTDSLEKTLILWKIEGKMRRG